MPKSESWKERLSFVTGVILTYGLIILGLWPKLARFQTGLHIHFWSTNLPQEGIKVGFYLFFLITILLGIAFTAVVLSLIHIASRGIWLSFSTETNEYPVRSLLERLDNLSIQTFRSVFLLSILFGVVLVLTSLILLSAGFENILTSSLSLSIKAAGWISTVIYVLLAGLLAGWAYIKLNKSYKEQGEGERLKILEFISGYISKTSLLSFVFFFVAWTFIIEFCYTLDLSLPTKSFSTNNKDLIEIYVSLGGGTSAIEEATLILYDSNHVYLKDLSLEALGKGSYISFMQSDSLKPDLYFVVLEYPHASLQSTFPFLDTRSSITEWFIVTQ